MAGVRTTTLDGILGAPAGLSDSEARKLTRRRLFMLLGGVVVIAALVALIWWYVVSSGYVSTDDAYVDASVAEITPQIDGLVRSVPVNDTQTVKRGQVLVVIDPVDQQIAVAQAIQHEFSAIDRRQ